MQIVAILFFKLVSRKETIEKVQLLRFQIPAVQPDYTQQNTADVLH